MTFFKEKDKPAQNKSKAENGFTNWIILNNMNFFRC